MAATYHLNNEDIVLNHKDIKELLELPYVVLDECNDKELRINGELVCCHKHLYPIDVLKALAEYGIINFTHEKKNNIKEMLNLEMRKIDETNKTY